jgi:hypothetical protein
VLAADPIGFKALTPEIAREAVRWKRIVELARG